MKQGFLFAFSASCFLLSAEVSTSPGDLDPTFGQAGWQLGSELIAGRGIARAVLPQNDGKVLVVGTVAVRGRQDDMFAARYLAATGELDTTYGTSGISTVDFGNTIDAGTDATLQSDGKLVIVGVCTATVNYSLSYCFTRLNTDGSLDTTFGTDGKAKKVMTTSTSNAPLYLNAVTTDSNDNIYAVGYGPLSQGVFPGTIAKLDANGTFVANFGDGGVLKPEASVRALHGVTVDSNDNVIAVGSRSLSRIAIVRINSSGQLDTTFAGTGLVSISNAERGEAVAIQSDGKIVVGHRLRSPALTDEYDVAVSRINMNGIVDTGFGVNGTASLDLEMLDEVRELQLMPDDAITIAGSAKRYSTTQVADAFFAKLDNDGVWTDFGNEDAINQSLTTTKVSRHSVLDTPLSSLRGLYVDTSGEIIANVNQAPAADYERHGLLKVTATGIRDSSFGDNGFVAGNYAVAAVTEWVQTLQGPNDKRYLLGKIDLQTAALARINADGSPDTSFGQQGMVVFSHGNFGADTFRALRMTIRQDGKIAVAHRPTNASSLQVRLYTVNGSLDTQFAYEGAHEISLPGNSAVSELLSDSSNRLFLIARSFGSNNTLWVYRITDTGDLDTSFGPPSGGHQTYDMTSMVDGYYENVAAAALDSVGGAVLAVDTGSAVRIMRLDEHGFWDAGFGADNGIMTLTHGNSFSVTSIIASDDNGWFVSGFGGSEGDGSRYAVVFKLDSQGLIDSDFADDGAFSWESIGFESWVNQLLKRENGALLLLGGAISAQDEQQMLVLLMEQDGSVDQSFHGDGYLTLQPPGTEGTALAGMLLSEDHGFLLAGKCGERPCLAQLDGWVVSSGLSTESLIFGNQSLTTSSVAQSVTLTNLGKTGLQLSEISVTGEFLQNNDCPQQLPANQSCTILVRFNPQTLGSRTGTIRLQLAGTSRMVTLSGTGTQAAVSISTGTLTFANQTVNSTSSAQQVAVNNIGSEPLSISGISITGDYAQTNNCPSTLAIGNSCTVSVTFKPTAQAVRSGELTVQTGVNISVVTLTGSGTAVAEPPSQGGGGGGGGGALSLWWCLLLPVLARRRTAS